ncbi:tubulin-folding cofactor b [Plakobranchus ocellatus]|uniref:Tubulin-folding cofactor b n=1 Tax=Plakobranchus ocellatus TaxID=259542 RepID=A0AAV4DCM3_9GAST|nr:tubulin-folding cofactor b [Plakobranchus ocellatus]
MRFCTCKTVYSYVFLFSEYIGQTVQMAGVTVSSNELVSVQVTSTVNKFGVERRFERSSTIAALKAKLELITGAFAQTMVLTVYTKDGKPVCTLNNDEALLGSYPVDDGMTLHADDPNLKGNEYSDTSKVEKFEISQEEYNKRQDSVRAFKERNKLGQFNEEERKRKEAELLAKEDKEEAKAKTFSVGDRCEVTVPGQPSRRGEVKYVGKTEFKPGVWVGVQYDEPHGKNDGSVGGKRYFECPEKYGGFMRPSHVEVGDFPEEDLGLDDDEM